MKLLYIWNSDYGNQDMHNKGFILNSEYYIAYDSLKNILTINKNNDYISDLWGVNVLDCFAVIGENGSGKTMLMNLLLQIWDELRNDSLPKNKYFIIFYNEEYSKIYIFYSGKKPEVAREEGVKFYFDKIGSDRPKVFKGFHVAYFQNILNKTDYLAKYRCEYDFSISRKIAYDMATTYEMHYDELSKDKILNYFSKEAFKIIEFLYDYAIDNSTYIPFPLPRKIQIKVSGEEYNTNYLIERAKRSGQDSDGEILEKGVFGYRDKIKKYVEKIDSLWIRNTIMQSLMNCLKSILFPSVSTSMNVKEKTYIFSEMAERLFEKSITYNVGKEACRSVIQELMILKELVDEHEKYIVEDTINFVSWVEENQALIISIENRDFSIIAEMGKHSKSFMKRMIELYSKICLSFPFYDFSFDISTGEYLFLSIFADLYHMKKSANIRRNAHVYPALKNGDYILLIFDESELAMHPRWQREYIKWIVDFCDQYFSEQKVQIFVTTHSPILLSDFPSKNVLYLKRNKSGSISVLYDYIKTFGNNIHTLYLNSFFLDDQGVIGSFAEKKINGIVEELLEDKINQNWSQDKLYRIQTMINLIGEEVVRTRLLELYQKKTGEQLRKIDGRQNMESEMVKNTISVLKAQKIQLEEMISKLEGQI